MSNCRCRDLDCLVCQDDAEVRSVHRKIGYKAGLKRAHSLLSESKRLGLITGAGIDSDLDSLKLEIEEV